MEIEGNTWLQNRLRMRANMEKKGRIEFPILAKENRPEYKISEAINNIEEFAHFNDNFIWKSLQSMETKEWEESREPFMFLLNK